MLRQPIWVAIAILLAFTVALAFLVVRGSCVASRDRPPRVRAPSESGRAGSTPSVAP